LQRHTSRFERCLVLRTQLDDLRLLGSGLRPAAGDSVESSFEIAQLPQLGGPDGFTIGVTPSGNNWPAIRPDGLPSTV